MSEDRSFGWTGSFAKLRSGSRRRIAGVCLGVFTLLWAAACSADRTELTSGERFPSGGSNGGGNGGAAADSGTIDTGMGGGGECNDTKPCASGVCVAGSCCASAQQACGTSCCAAGEVCLFEACVVPGSTCQTPADCADGQYCETALGTAPSDAGAGGSGASAGQCTQPIPPSGRCLDFPPVCEGDAGTSADGGSCIPKCEYHPPLDKLNAVVKWQWGLDPAPVEFPSFADVWATPTIARVYDANCDGKVDESDPPNVIFVSGDAKTSCCSCGGHVPSTCLTGKLRLLDGRSGKEIWSLDRAKPGTLGFAGLSVALGDLDGDQRMDVVAMTGDGYLTMIDATGAVERVSDFPVDTRDAANFGWGGGIAIADMDGDGQPEIAYGRNLYSTAGGKITRQWVGVGGNGGTGGRELSFFVDLNGDGKLELLAGNTAYLVNGTPLWSNATLPNGFNAVADFDLDGRVDVVLVESGQAWVLHGADGSVALGPLKLPGAGNGGPPTVADFDGDGKPEIGVALQDFYSMLKPDFATQKLLVVWSAPTHDLSSSVTGSSVFDFEGDGKAEVVYNDECFLWVYDGQTGAVRFNALTTSFTATEASLVADVDGDGHSEIVMVSNGADPGPDGWKCNIAPWNKPDAASGRPAWTPPPGAPAYRGITVFGDKENSWVGTRTLWTQHAYHVTNVCDARDGACDAPNLYGSIPKQQKENWKLGWLNNFRQNVQDKGIFDAPDATLSLAVGCATPVELKVSVRNVGLAGLPAGVDVGIFAVTGGTPTQIGTVTTKNPLLPGQTEVLSFAVPAGSAGESYLGRILIDPQNKKFNECRDDNNESVASSVGCGPA